MDVVLLHVADCPNLDRARSRLDDALEQVGMTAPVREIQLDTSEEAGQAGMQGSPTILIDGVDPFATASSEASLSCRLYPTSAGLDGAPTTAQLVAALTQRRSHAQSH